MNHETQLDLRLAGSKEFGLLLKLILYTAFEVITGFLCPFNRRIRFKTQFHAIVSLVEETFQTANKQGRAERKLLHVKMSSGATYAVVRRTPYAVGARVCEPFRLPWPKFLASIGYHFSLPMGLCARAP